MFASLFRGSDREQVQVPPAWLDIVEHIDVAFVEIHNSFRLAFAEGYEKGLPTKEFIKRKVFDAVWKLLQNKKLSEFESLAELDDHFSGLQQGLAQSIKVYCQQPSIQRMCKMHNIEEALSESKTEMLLLLAKQFHALLRTKFILLEINKDFTKSPYAADDCYQAVQVFKQQCELVPDLIRDIDIDSYRYGHAESVVQLNHKLAELFYNAGYGQIDTDNLTPVELDEQRVDYKFLEFYRELRELLPSIREMNALVKEKPNPERNRRLQEAVIKLELARNLLLEFREKLSEHHVKKMQALQKECDSLKSSIAGLRDSDKFQPFFQKLYLFVRALVNEDETKGLLGLIPTGDEVAACAGRQSIGATLLIRNNGWNGAKTVISNHVGKYSQVDKATNAIFSTYSKSRKIYNEAFAIIDELNNDWLGSVDALKDHWTNALADTDYVVSELEGLINKAQAILGRSAESNAEYWKGFVKRHWWKGALIAALPVGGGAAAGVLLFKSTIAAVGLPVLGLLFGGATGTGVGFAQDSKKPPLPNKEPEVHEGNVELHSMRDLLNRMFESEEDVIRTKLPEQEMREEPMLFSLYDEDEQHLSSDEGEDESSELSHYSRVREQQILLFGQTVPDQLNDGPKENRIHTFSLE